MAELNIIAGNWTNKILYEFIQDLMEEVEE
jgi:hypothetical protein